MCCVKKGRVPKHERQKRRFLRTILSSFFLSPFLSFFSFLVSPFRTRFRVSGLHLTIFIFFYSWNHHEFIFVLLLFSYFFVLSPSDSGLIHLYIIDNNDVGLKSSNFVVKVRVWKLPSRWTLIVSIKTKSWKILQS